VCNIGLSLEFELSTLEFYCIDALKTFVCIELEQIGFLLIG